MQSLTLILFLLLLLNPTFCFAGATEVKQDITQSSQNMGIIGQTLNANALNLCDDLYAASCLMPNGTPKSTGLKLKMDNIVQDALSQAVLAMERPADSEATLYQSISAFGLEEAITAAYIRYLKVNGLTVRKGLSSEQVQNLRSGSVWNIEEYFTDIPNNCYGKGTELADRLTVECKTTEEYESKATQIIQKYQFREMKKYEELPRQLTIDNLRECEELSKSLSNRLERFTVAKKTYESEFAMGNTLDYTLNPKAMDISIPAHCAPLQKYELRKTSVDLFRGSDLKEFVQTFYANLKETRQAKLQADRSNFYIYEYSNMNYDRDWKSEIGHACYNSTKRMDELRLESLRKKFFGNLTKSKPVVDTIFDSVYGTEQKNTVSALYLEARAEIIRWIKSDLPRISGDPRFELFLNSVNGLELNWPDKPNDTLYKNEQNFPLPVLDFDQVLPFDNVLSAFKDESLSFFKEMNAFYQVPVKYGDFEVKETVHLMPTVNILAQKNRWTALFIIAHEIGHKLGPKVSKFSGYDLSPALRKLTDCLADQSSINAKSFQQDEAIADWIATKAIAGMLAKLPPRERKDALLKVSEFFCESEAEDLYSYAPIFDGVHPETILRVNGILGSDSNVRKLVGCTPSRKFSDCTIYGSTPASISGEVNNGR